jgi:hypothetical protein
MVFLKAGPVSENSLVSTSQADKKKTCVEKTSSNWEFSAILKTFSAGAFFLPSLAWLPQFTYGIP